MKNFFIVLIILLFNSTIFAQESYLKDVEETKEVSKEITVLFSQNKISQSFDELAPIWPLPQNEIDIIKEKTVKYLNLLRERFGEPIGTLKIKNEIISDIATRETYLIRYEWSAIRLIYTYYKNDNGWILNGFKWDDSFTEEFVKN